MSVIVVLSATPVDPDAIKSAVKRHGISAVALSPAADFSLADLDGKTAALSDSKGRWVLLTFFAEWCGPCKAELPSLERLHQSHQTRGLEVLGVATDGSRQQNAAFLKRLGVTFRTFVDDGQVAAMYRASSIPLSYIITPDGRIVGASRGARDWSKLGTLFDELSRLMPADDIASSAYAAQQAAVELPPALEPPTAKVALAGEGMTVKRAFDLDVTISWAGNFDDYLLHPPRVTLPDGIEEVGTSASTSSQAGRAVISYRIRLLPHREGSFALDPVELRFTPSLEAQPQTSRIKGPTVEVQPVTVMGLNPWVMLGAILGTLGLGLAAGLGTRTLRGRAQRTREAAGAADAVYQARRAAFESARRMRLEGDVAGFLEAMAALDGDLGAGASPEELAQWVEAARYGGQPPAPEALDLLQRRLERALGEAAPASSLTVELKSDDTLK